MRLFTIGAVTLGMLVLLPPGWAVSGDTFVGSRFYQISLNPEEDATQGGAAEAEKGRPPCPCEQECCGCQQCRCDPQCGPLWTVTVDLLALERVGAPNVTLIRNCRTYQELLNAKDFHLGSKGGPRLSLTRHGECGNDIEFVYFAIDGWWDSQSRNSPDDVRFDAPFFWAVASQNCPMRFDWTSKLYNAELNLWMSRCGSWRLLAGLRFVELRESLIGGIPGGADPFWTTSTDNHLYGFQVGADATLWDRGGPFYVTGVLKAGVYTNHAQQFSACPPLAESAVAEVNHAAFLGEMGITGYYRLSDCAALRLGYEMIWLQGVAVAPGQVHVSDIGHGVGFVDTNGAVFYHGLLAGIEVSF